MCERKMLDLSIPNFEESGYLGSISISAENWQEAAVVATKRQSIALDGKFQKLAKDPVKQYQKDLKGAIGEIGFFNYFNAVAKNADEKCESVDLVSDKPVAKQDITFQDMKFDIKSCAAPVNGFTTRDDKLLAINCTQHDKKYLDYKGYFFIKSYENHQDIFYFKRGDVGLECGWTREPGKQYHGDYYARKLPSVH